MSPQPKGESISNETPPRAKPNQMFFAVDIEAQENKTLEVYINFQPVPTTDQLSSSPAFIGVMYSSLFSMAIRFGTSLGVFFNESEPLLSSSP
mmetsp:Transcript_3378/g.4833  ORF Transcript_3378/g.4833 Transcript_3378/m.4833 type:complete len:93 (-) Transcript_3378:9-287(-)